MPHKLIIFFSIVHTTGLKIKWPISRHSLGKTLLTPRHSLNAFPDPRRSSTREMAEASKCWLPIFAFSCKHKLNLAYTTRQGSRVSCFAKTGFAAFGKMVQLISGPKVFRCQIPKREWHDGQRQIMGTQTCIAKDTAFNVLWCEACVFLRDAPKSSGNSPLAG